MPATCSRVVIRVRDPCPWGVGVGKAVVVERARVRGEAWFVTRDS